MEGGKEKENDRKIVNSMTLEKVGQNTIEFRFEQEVRKGLLRSHSI